MIPVARMFIMKPGEVTVIDVTLFEFDRQRLLIISVVDTLGW